MTRTTEPAFTSTMRRAARDGDRTEPLGARLDTQARSAGFGTWSALLRADPATTPYDCIAPGRWDGEGASCMTSPAFNGKEADLLRLCVHQLAADVRAIPLPTLNGSPISFEALGAETRLSSWVVVSPRWCTRIASDGEFDDDRYEGELALARRVSEALETGTQDTWSHLSWLVGRTAMRRVFTGATTLVDVREGRIHRVAVRLNQHGGIVWEARLDVGYQVTITIEEHMPRSEGEDLEAGMALIADATIGGRVDPQDLGLIPFAPVRRKQEGQPFAYMVREGDLGRLAGVTCRMADPDPIRWPLGTIRTAA